ncbi:MAG: cytochrome c [Bacteroidota bacterium]
MRNKLFIFLVIAVITFACGGKNKNAGVVDGRATYKSYCITCHGAKGNMGAGGAFNLRVSALTLEERIAVITNGRKAMTAFQKILSEEEIAAVAAYTLTLKE